MHTCPESVANFIYTCPEWVVYQKAAGFITTYVFTYISIHQSIHIVVIRIYTYAHTCLEVTTNYTCPEMVVYQETSEWYPIRDKYILWGSPRPARRVYIYKMTARPLYCSGGGIYVYICI